MLNSETEEMSTVESSRDDDDHHEDHISNSMSGLEISRDDDDHHEDHISNSMSGLEISRDDDDHHEDHISNSISGGEISRDDDDRHEDRISNSTPGVEISIDDDDRHKDRISNLPVSVMRTLLFYSPVKDEVRTRILSKTWKNLDTFSPLPVLSLNFDQFYQSLDDLAENQRERVFLRQVEDVFKLLETTRHEICFFQFGRPADHSFFDKWIPLLVRHHLKLCCLKIDPHLRGFIHHDHLYKFPEVATASATPLNALIIRRCCLQRNSLCDDINGHFDAALPLQHLVLSDVRLYNKDGVFQDFISRCTSLTHLSMLSCSGLKTLRLDRNPELTALKVKMRYERDEQFENIQVISQNLHTVTCTGIFGKPLIVDAKLCPNLRQLHLCKADLEQQLIDDLQLMFPHLNDLSLCTGLDRLLELRHESLERVRLLSNDLDALQMIDVPKLVDFCYGSLDVPGFVFSCDLESVEKVELGVAPQGMLDTSWFHELQTCLTMFQMNKNVALTLQLYQTTCTFDVDEVGQMTALAVKELVLDLTATHFESYQRLFDGLFWVCRPKNITITTPANSDIMKVICESLVPSKDADVDAGCNCPFVSCWHRCLEDIDIYSMPDETRVTLFEMDTILESHGTGQSFKFLLSWM